MSCEVENYDLCEDLGHPKCLALIWVRRLAAILSMFGCLFIIVAIILFQRHRNFSQRLIMFLSTAAFLDSIPYLLGRIHPDKDTTCIFQAFWMQYFDWATLLWVCCVAFNLYVNVVQRIDTQKWEAHYHAISWGWPMLMAVIPLGTNSFGPAGPWCWIDRHSWMRFAFWYVPLLICICGLIVLYSLLTYRVNRQINQWQGTYNPEVEGEKVMLKKYIEPLRFYPLVYILTATFPVINRIQNAVNPCDPVFTLFLLHSLSAPMMGFLNAVVYARSGGFWRSLSYNSVKRAFYRLVQPQRVKEYPIGFDDVSAADDEHGLLHLESGEA